MFSTLGNIISVSMLYTTIIYSQLGIALIVRVSPILLNFTWTKLLIQKATTQRQALYQILTSFHYCYHKCSLSFISICHHIARSTFLPFYRYWELLVILFQLLLSTIFINISELPFFKPFSDISQYCLYDFSYSRQNFIFLIAIIIIASYQ